MQFNEIISSSLQYLQSLVQSLACGQVLHLQVPAGSATSPSCKLMTSGGGPKMTYWRCCAGAACCRFDTVLRMSTSPFGFLHGGAVLPLVVLAFSVGGSARSFGRCNPGTPTAVERDSRSRVPQHQVEGSTSRRLSLPGHLQGPASALQNCLILRRLREQNRYWS
jgi:hypothetical protein